MNKATKAAILAVATLLIVGSSVAAPRLLIKQESFDFGYAPQNSKVSHIFWLYSIGDDTLKILSVKPG
jgi:branched-subunit amino acid permease